MKVSILSLFSVVIFCNVIVAGSNNTHCLSAMSDQDSVYSFAIIPSEAQTYGYEIYNQKQIFIKQLSIPGLPGLNGFKRKTDAEKVATLVINKLLNHIVPPTVSKKEMDSLKVIY